jgi:hypothetical protein
MGKAGRAPSTGGNAATEQLIDLGDRVVVLARMIGTSRTTGAAVDWPFGGVFADFCGGMFAEGRYFMDHKAALEAAGLSE